jgi:hypothetical protein
LDGGKFLGIKVFDPEGFFIKDVGKLITHINDNIIQKSDISHITIGDFFDCLNNTFENKGFQKRVA